MENKKNKNATNMGYAIIVTVILVIVAVFINLAIAPDSDETAIGEIIGIFNLVAIIYFGKTILDKLDK